MSSDGAGSPSLNHDGLVHEVLQPGLGQGVAKTSDSPSTLVSLLGPGEMSLDGAGSPSLNHKGLVHDVPSQVLAKV